MSFNSSAGGRSPDEGTKRYYSRTDPVSLRVVEAVAAFRETDPLELKPLAESIDTDALNTLFSPVSDGRIDGSDVSFTYEGVRVTVTGRGDVRLREAEAGRTARRE